MIRELLAIWRSSWVSRFASLAIFGVLLMAVTAPPAQATVGDRNVATYNMQGASSGKDSTWSTITSNYDGRFKSPAAWGCTVIALQEVGANPPPQPYPGNDGEKLYSVPMPPGVIGSLPDPTLFQRTGYVRHTQWLAPDRHPYDVYFLQTDRARNARGQATYDGGRVNLAILTDSPAEDVAVIPNPAYNRVQDDTAVAATGTNTDQESSGTEGLNTARPALGVLRGGTWYFNIHALSGGGSDVAGLLGNIQAFMDSNEQRGRDALVLGDFNRNPGGYDYPSTQRAIAFSGTTQISGNTLDYGVTVNARADAPPMMATLLPWGGSSDHVPVRISPTPNGQPLPNGYLPIARDGADGARSAADRMLSPSTSGSQWPAAESSVPQGNGGNASSDAAGDSMTGSSSNSGLRHGFDSWEKMRDEL